MRWEAGKVAVACPHCPHCRLQPPRPNMQPWTACATLIEQACPRGPARSCGRLSPYLPIRACNGPPALRAPRVATSIR
eukprot:361763-Chlamydomonas_euryale.AAC.2